MAPPRDQFASIVSAVAIIVAAAVTLILPITYFLMAYANLAASVATKAQVKAEMVNQIISASPRMWAFQDHRMNELLARFPRQGRDESSYVFDAHQEVVAAVENPLTAPVLVRAIELYDSGLPVGHLEVRHSLRPLLLHTTLVAVFGMVMGGAVFVTLRLFPLRALRRVSEALVREKERAQVTLRSIGDAVITTDESGRIDFMNRVAEHLSGWAFPEARGRPLGAIFRLADEVTGRPLENAPRQASRGQRPLALRDRTALVRRDGALLPVEISVAPIGGDNGMNGAVVAFHDVSKARAMATQLFWQANHDALTGLPNRTFFQARCGEAIARARRHKSRLALLFIDLDRFKTVNDSLGHAAGDLLLQKVAQRIVRCVRESDTVARLGGDEFIVLLEDIVDPKNGATIAQKLLDILSEPFAVAGRDLSVTASIGVSCYPQDGHDGETLLKNADAAMYRAKDEGRNTYQFFCTEMNDQALELLLMTSTLRNALERREFVLHYQPRVDLRSGRITGVEALIRRIDPRDGLIGPARFIPLAEETGMIVPIGEWVLRTACAQAKTWQEMGIPGIRMAVNLSARQFRQPDLTRRVQQILLDTGLDPHWLELELTEGVVMRDPERTRSVLSEIKALGVCISIDDFGTGYSSLSYLRRFPNDYLKIDRSFVSDVPGDAENSAIARAIIALAYSLKLGVIAEGVEREEQRAFLQAAGCGEMQGYLFSRPNPAHALEALLRANLQSNVEDHRRAPTTRVG